MNTIGRKQIILQKLYEQGSVNIADLSQELAVSSMTIRRDLAKLNEEGLVTLEHGGAVLNNGSLFELGIPLKRMEKNIEKSSIAAKAAEFIHDGDSVYLDAGTTAAEIAKLLFNRKKLVVLTHSLLVVNILSKAPNIRTIMCPGEFRETSMAFVGPLTDAFIQQFKIDIFFLGVEGIDPLRGATVQDVTDGVTKRCLVKNAEKVICVADSSKFNHSYLYRVCPLPEIDVIITDQGLKTDVLTAYRQQDVSIITV